MVEVMHNSLTLLSVRVVGRFLQELLHCIYSSRHKAISLWVMGTTGWMIKAVLFCKIAKVFIVKLWSIVTTDDDGYTLSAEDLFISVSPNIQTLQVAVA